MRYPYPLLSLLLLLLALPSLDPYRIHDPDTGAPLTAAYFVPYDPGFVGRAPDPDNPRRYRVNEGNPFSLAQPNIFRGVLPRQDCPSMIGPYEHGVYYCTSKDAGYCDRRSGACFCSKGYQGKDCSVCRSTHMRNTTTGTCDPKVICPNDCSGAGTCDTTTGMCTCRKNRRGIDCSLHYCRLLHRWCTNCNEQQCQTCEQGYFVDTDGKFGGMKGTCKPCTVHDPRCIECDAHSCLTCADPLLSSIRRSGRRRKDPLLPWDEDERLLSRTLPFGTQSPYAFEEAEPFILITDQTATITMGIQRSIWSPAEACFSLLGIQNQRTVNVNDTLLYDNRTNSTLLLRIGVISSSDLSTDGNSGQVRRYYINCTQLLYMDSYYGYGPTGNDAIEGPVEGGVYGSKLTPIVYPPGLLDIDDGASIVDVYGEPLNMSRLVDMVEEFLILTGGGVGYGDGSSILITGKGLNVTWWKDLKGYRRNFIRGDLYTNTTNTTKTLYVLPNYYSMRRQLLDDEKSSQGRETHTESSSAPDRQKIERFLMDINITTLNLNNPDQLSPLTITTVPRNSIDFTTNNNPFLPLPLLNASALACEQGYQERKDDSWTCSHVRISHVVCGHPGTINFNSPTYAVLESDQYLAVTIQRSGGGLGRVSVRIQLEHESTDDSDVSLTAQYTTSRELVFEEGVVALTFRITIHDDRLIEPVGEAGRANYTNQIPLQTVFLDDESTITTNTSTTNVNAKTVVVGSFAASLLSSLQNISSLSSAAKSYLDGKLYTSGGYKRLGDYRYLTTVLQPGVSSESNALARSQGGLDTLHRIPAGFVRQSRRIPHPVRSNDTLTITVLPDTDILQPSTHLENSMEWNRSIVYFRSAEYLNFVRLFDEPIIMNTTTGKDNYLNTGFPNTGIYNWHNRLGPHETFRLRLYNPTGGAHLGAQAFTTVAIIDDDTFRVLPATTRAEGELLTAPTAAILVDAIARGAIGSSLLPVDTDMNDLYYQQIRTGASSSATATTLPYRKVHYEELTGKQQGLTESSQTRLLPYALVGEETSVYIHPNDGAGFPVTSSRYTALHFDALNAPDIIPASLLGEEKFIVTLEPLPDVSVNWLISHLVRILTIEGMGSIRMNVNNRVDEFSLSSILWYMLDTSDTRPSDVNPTGSRSSSGSDQVRDTTSLGVPARVPFPFSTGLPNLTATSWTTVPLIYSEPDDDEKNPNDKEFASFINSIGSRMMDGIGNTQPQSTFSNPSVRQIYGMDQSRQRLQQVFDRWSQDYELTDNKNLHVQTWKDILQAISSLLWNNGMGPEYSYQSGDNTDHQSGTFTNDDALAFTAVLGIWPGSSSGGVAMSGDGGFGKVSSTAVWWKAGFNDTFLASLVNDTNADPSFPSTPLDAYLAKASSTIVKKDDIGTYKATIIPVRSGLTQVSIVHAVPGGLRGSYYGNTFFQGNPLLQRIDSLVNFTWGLGPIFEVKQCVPCGGIEKENLPYGEGTSTTVSQPGMCGITGVGASDFALNHTGNVLLPFGSTSGFSPQAGTPPLQFSPFDRGYTVETNTDNEDGNNERRNREEEEEQLIASLMDQTAHLTHRPDSATVSSTYARGGRRRNSRTVSGTTPSGLGSSSTGCTTGSWTDYASVRWNGKIGLPLDETNGYYTFVLFADDHVRLWIDNNLVIDAWGGKTGTGRGSSNTRRFMNDDQSTTISARTGSDHVANLYMDDYEDNPNVLNKRRSRYDIIPSTLTFPSLTDPLFTENTTVFQGPLPKPKDATTVCTYSRLDSGGNRAEGSANIPVHTDSLFAMDIVCMDTSHPSSLPSSLDSVKNRDRVWTNPSDQQSSKYPRTTTMYHELSGILNSQRSLGGMNYFDQAYVGLRSPPILLQKDQLYDIVLEYRDTNGWAACRLAWITPTMVRLYQNSTTNSRSGNEPLVPVTVPSEALYSVRHISGSPSLTYVRPGIGYAEGIGTTIENTNTTVNTTNPLTLPDYTNLEELWMDTVHVRRNQSYTIPSTTGNTTNDNYAASSSILGSTLGSSRSYGTYAEGNGLLHGIAGESTDFTIYSRDMYGNNRKGESIGDVYWIQAVLLSPDPAFDITVTTVSLDNHPRSGSNYPLTGLGNVTLHTLTVHSRSVTSTTFIPSSNETMNTNTNVIDDRSTIIYGTTEYDRVYGNHKGMYTAYRSGIYSLSTRLRTDWRTFTYIMNSPSVLRIVPNLPSPRLSLVWGQGIHPTGFGVVVGNPYVVFVQPRDEYQNTAVIDIGKDIAYMNHPNIRHIYSSNISSENNNREGTSNTTGTGTTKNSLILVEDITLLPLSLQILVDAYYEGTSLTPSSSPSAATNIIPPHPDTLPYSSLRAKTTAILLPFPSSYSSNGIANDWNGTVIDIQGTKIVLQFHPSIRYPLPSYLNATTDHSTNTTTATASEGLPYQQSNIRLVLFVSTYVPIMAGSYRITARYTQTNAFIASSPYYTVVAPTVSAARTTTLALRSPSSKAYVTYSPYTVDGNTMNTNSSSRSNVWVTVPPHVDSPYPAEFEVTVYDRYRNLRVGQNKQFTTLHWNTPSTSNATVQRGQTYTRPQQTDLPIDLIDPLSDNLTAYVDYTVHTPFGPVNYTRPAEVRYNGCCNATYTILSPCGGLACRLTVLLRNKPIQHSPFFYTRSSSLASAKYSYYWGPGTMVNTAGKRSWFIIQLRDDDGNPVMNQWSLYGNENSTDTIKVSSSSSSSSSSASYDYVRSLVRNNRLQVRIRRIGGVRAEEVESSLSIGSTTENRYTRKLKDTDLDTWYRKQQSSRTDGRSSFCGGLQTATIGNGIRQNPFFQSPLDQLTSVLTNSTEWQSLLTRYLSTCPLPSLTVPLQMHTLASYLYQYTNDYHLLLDNYVTYSNQRLTSSTLPRIQPMKLNDVLRLRNITTRWDIRNPYMNVSVYERSKHIRTNVQSRLYPSQSLPSLPLIPDLPYYTEKNLPREWLYDSIANITVGIDGYTSTIYNGDMDDVWLRSWVNAIASGFVTNGSMNTTDGPTTTNTDTNDNHYGYLDDNAFELSVIPDNLNNDQSSSGGYVLVSYTTMREGIYELLVTLDDEPLNGFTTLPHSSGDTLTSSSLPSLRNKVTGSNGTNTSVPNNTVSPFNVSSVLSSTFVPLNPLSIVLPGPMDPTMTIVEGSGTRIGYVGKSTALTVTSRDIYGNRCNRPSVDIGKLYMRMRPLTNTDNQPITIEDSIQRNLTKIIPLSAIPDFAGAYTADFLPLVAGTSEVEITYLPQTLGLWTEYFAQPFWMRTSTLSRNPSQYTYDQVQKRVMGTVASTIVAQDASFRFSDTHIIDTNDDNLDYYLASWYTYGNLTTDLERDNPFMDEQMTEKLQNLLSSVPGKPILQRFEPLPYFSWNYHNLQDNIQRKNPAAVIISETVGWSVRWSGFLQLPFNTLSDTFLRNHIGNALTVPIHAPLLYPEVTNRMGRSSSSTSYTSSWLRNDTVEVITFFLRVKGGHAVFALRSWDSNYTTAMPRSTMDTEEFTNRTYSSSVTSYLGGLRIIGPDESDRIRQEIQASLPLQAPTLASLTDTTKEPKNKAFDNLSSYNGWIRLIDTKDGIGWLNDWDSTSGDTDTEVPTTPSSASPSASRGYDEVWSVSIPLQSHAYYGLFIGYSHTGDHNQGSLDNPSERMIVPCSFTEYVKASASSSSSSSTANRKNDTCHISMKIVSRTFSAQHISSIPWAKLIRTMSSSVPDPPSVTPSASPLSKHIPLRSSDITYQHYTEQAITLPPAFLAPPLVQSVGSSPFTLSIAADTAYAPMTTLVWYIPQLNAVDASTTNELLQTYEYNTTYENPTFTAEHTVTCFIRIHDQFGNARVYGDMAANDKVYVWAVQVPSTIDPTIEPSVIIYPEDITVTYIGKARYRIYFVPRTPGNYRLYVAINPPFERMNWSRGIAMVIGEALAGNSLAGMHTTPYEPVSSLEKVKGVPRIPYFVFTVEASTVIQDSYALSYAYGEGLAIATSGFSSAFYVQLVDTAGNNMTTLPDEERAVSLQHTDRSKCPRGSIAGTVSSLCIPFVDAVFTYLGPLPNQYDDGYTNTEEWNPRKERSPFYPYPHPVPTTIEITTYATPNHNQTYINMDNDVRMYAEGTSSFLSTIPTTLSIHYRSRIRTGLWYIEYIPIASGMYSVTIFINGVPIRKNPYRISVYPSTPVARTSSIELDPLNTNTSEALRLKYTSYLSLTLNPGTADQDITTEASIQGGSSSLPIELQYTESSFVRRNGGSVGTVQAVKTTNWYTPDDPYNGIRPVYRRYPSRNGTESTLRTGWIGYIYRYPRSIVPLKGLYNTLVNKQIRVPGTGSIVPAPYRETFIPYETLNTMDTGDNNNDPYRIVNQDSWSNYANSLYGTYPTRNPFFPRINTPIGILNRSLRNPSVIDQSYGITSITEGRLNIYVRTRDIYGSPLRTGKNILYSELRRANDYRTTPSLYSEFAYFQGLVEDRYDGVYRIHYTVPLAYNRTIGRSEEGVDDDEEGKPTINGPEATIHKETMENLVEGPWILEVWLLLPTYGETETVQKDPLTILPEKGTKDNSPNVSSLAEETLQYYTRPLLLPSSSSSSSSSSSFHQQRLFYRQSRMHGLLGYYWSSDNLVPNIPLSTTSGNSNIIQRTIFPTNIPNINNGSIVTAIDPLSLWRTNVWSAVPYPYATTMMGKNTSIRQEFDTVRLQNFSSVLWTGFLRPTVTGMYSFLLVCDGPCEFTLHFNEDTTDIVRTFTDTDDYESTTGLLSPLTLMIGGGLAGGTRETVKDGELFCTILRNNEDTVNGREEYGRRTWGGTPLSFSPPKNSSYTVPNLLFERNEDYDTIVSLHSDEVIKSKGTGCLTMVQSTSIYLQANQAYALQNYLRRRIGSTNDNGSSSGVYALFWAYTGVDEFDSQSKEESLRTSTYRKIPYDSLYYRGELVHGTPLPVWID